MDNSKAIKALQELVRRVKKQREINVSLLAPAADEGMGMLITVVGTIADYDNRLNTLNNLIKELS